MGDTGQTGGNLQAIAADLHGERQVSPLSGWASVEALVPQLSACLALVRPVGMSDEAAAEWLAVAASELAGYSGLLVEAGLADARRTCSHHAKIVPHVIKWMEDATPWRMGKPLARQVSPRTVQPLPAPEVARLTAELARSLSDHG